MSGKITSDNPFVVTETNGTGMGNAVTPTQIYVSAEPRVTVSGPGARLLSAR